MEENPPAEDRRPVPFRDRLSIWLIAFVAFAMLLCMAATVIVLALRSS